MSKIDTGSVGGPAHTRLHRTRGGAAVVAAIAGGVAFSLLAIAALGGVAPAESPLLWIAVVVFVAVWLTGLYWRWDAPDARDRDLERERRGYRAAGGARRPLDAHEVFANPAETDALKVVLSAA